MKIFFLKSLRQARRLVIAIIGFSVLLIGMAMIILPGPAFIVIPASLMILGTEFIWARNLLVNIKKKFKTNSK
jgi:tellurite resistance protein TerC